MINILFVCMGNICRSPSAEGFFRKHVEARGLGNRFTIDSAGTHSYHVGQAPDHRAIAEARRFGVDISGLRARHVNPQDFQRFDHIIPMDHHNLGILESMQPAGGRARLSLMMAYASGSEYQEVPDPYYGTQGDFELMCRLLEQATQGLLSSLSAEVGN